MKQTKANLIANITQDISDNATQEITPKDVRQNLLDIVDSVGNLLFTEEIVSTNFSTPATRTTIAGENVLSKLGQESYVSVDNSAFGYAALKQNFAGERNTALGAYALSCNVYGTDNVGVGYSSLAGNSNGVANVGIGEYTLYYNKLGNMNVAIGHGAGYYADREDSNKLYIAVHPVTEQYVCDNPEGVGLTPLVYGDFNLGKFGINVNDFHPYGTVQVSGAISPSLDESFDLGHENYSFNTAHARAISFSTGISNTYDPITNSVLISGVQTHSGDIKPSTSNVYSIGSPSNNWRNIHTYNLTVTGTANINELKTITSCLYECKTLYLATSGVCDGEIEPCGYLSEAELGGAGLVIPSSGTSGLSTYEWVIIPTGLSTQNLAPQPGTPEDNAYWASNNNIILSGDYSHIKAAKYLGTVDGRASFGGMIGNASNGFGGMNVDVNDTYQRVIFTTNDGFAGGSYDSLQTAGVGDFGSFYSNYVFNIYGNQTDTSPLSTDARRVTINNTDINVPVSLNLNHGVAHKRGVELYSTSSGTLPGFFITTHDGSSDNHSINTVSIMEDDVTGGVLGVSNFEDQEFSKYPETIINARSTSDASIRVTAENAGNVSAALELCGELNCLQDAGEIVYNKTSGVMVMSTYADSGRVDHITLKHTSGPFGGSSFGIYNDAPAMNSMVNIGNASRNTGLAFSNFPSGYMPSTTAGFTTLIARDVDSFTQSSELIYVDTSGNAFPLSLVTDNSSALFGDGTNLFGGSGCPADRSNVVPSSGNTGYGAEALSSITSAAPVSILNTAVGYRAGYGLTHSTGNIVVGSDSILPSVSGIHRNVVVGNNVVASGSDNLILGNDAEAITNGSILIGRNLNATTLPDSTFLVGADDNILLSGVLNQPSNLLLSMPDNGSFRLYGANNLESTTIASHAVNVVGSGTRYGETPFTINFTGEDGALSNDLVTLDHSAYYIMNNVETYETTNPRRPFMHIDGDLQVRGALRLADGTSLESAGAVNDIEALIQALQDQIDVQTIEGTMIQDVDSPPNRFIPTQGLITLLDGTTETIVNRDVYLRLEEGDYVIANRVMGPSNVYEYRPVWVSNENTTCGCSRPTTT
jgi:hypothetical protein